MEVNWDIFVGLIYNAALLLALGIIFDSITLRNYRNNWLSQILTGICIGGVALAIMINPFVLKPGVGFDTRSILLSLTAMFFGTIPTIITTIIALSFRIWQGGAGIYMGCSVMVASVLLGFVWKKLHNIWKYPYGFLEFYSLGILTHLVMLSLTPLLPLNIRFNVFSTIALPVMVIYPLATVLLGQIIVRRIYHRQEKAELIKVKKDWETIFQAIPHPTFILDKDQNVLVANINLEKALGITTEQMQGKKCWELMHGDDAHEPPHGCPFADSCSKENYIAEEMAVQALGGWYLVTCNAIFDKEGNVDKVIHIAMNITDRKNAETILAESEEKYRILSETARDIILVHQLDGSVSYANQVTLDFLGITADELPEVNLWNNISPEYHPMLQQNAAERKAGFSGSRLFELELVSKTGQRIHVEVSSSPIITNGSMTGLLAVMRDITEFLSDQKAIKDSQARFEQFMEYFPGGAFISDSQSKALYVNPYLIRVFGPKGGVGSIPTDVFPADIGEAIITDDKLALEQGYRHVELAVPHIDGTTHIYETIKFAIKRENAEDLLGGIIQDITDRKIAECALQESQAVFELFMDQIPGGVFIKDKNSRFLFVNKYMVQNYGADNWIDKGPEETFPEEEARETLANDDFVLKEGIYRTVDAYTAKDGKLRFFETTKFAIDRAGKEELIGGVSLNITDKKLAEEEIQRYARRLEILHEIDSIVLETLSFETVSQSVLENLHMLVPCSILSINTIENLSSKIVALYKDTDKYQFFELGKVTSIRPEFVQELKARQVNIINDADESTMSEYMPVQTRLFQAGMRSIMFITLTVQNEVFGFLAFVSEKPDFFSKTNQEVLVEIAKHISIAMQHKILLEQIRKYTEDLETKVEERTEQLLNANKELEAFSHTVAHDLRSPIRTIDGYSSILLEDHISALDAEAIELLHVIKRNTHNMDILTKELLELAKLNPYSLRFQQLDMKEMVSDIINDILKPETKVLFDIQIEELQPAYADKTLIRQVWQNLLDNAVKFTLPQSDKHITIGSFARDEDIVYFVRDTGVGFDIKYFEKIFRPFQQLNHKSDYEGTGIGLAIVKKIIQRHNGTIWAESEQGIGSTFYFSLPAKPKL